MQYSNKINDNPLRASSYRRFARYDLNHLFGALLALILFSCNAVSMAETHRVSIKDFKFQPAEITIQPGDSIEWVNNEKRQYHSVWFEQLGEPEPEYFFPEESYQRRFAQAGDFPYRCGPHPEMTGTVHVLTQTKLSTPTTEFSGYFTAHFGMSREQVELAIKADEKLSLQAEQKDKEIIKAVRLRKEIQHSLATEVSYVIPLASNKLALVVEFFPANIKLEQLTDLISQKFGQALGKAATEEAFKQIKDQLPADVLELKLWVGKQGAEDRFIRLLRFSNHIAVEYLAPNLLAEAEQM